jgi:hypothetical protein
MDKTCRPAESRPIGIYALGRIPPRPPAGKEIHMAAQEPCHPVDDRADFPPVAILVVHHDPLPVPERLDLLAHPLEKRIKIADKTRQHRRAGPGPREIEQRAGAADHRDDAA